MYQVAPTDCRYRPDLRALENGDLGKYLHCLLLYLEVFLCLKYAFYRFLHFIFIA